MNPDGTYNLDAREQRMFDDLRRINLRHPHMVSARVQKIVRQESLSDAQLQAVRLEWLKLCGGA